MIMMSYCRIIYIIFFLHSSFLIRNSTSSVSIDNLKLSFENLKLSNESIIAFPGSLLFMKLLVPANHACNKNCPFAIVCPKYINDITKLILFSNSYNISISVKGGGHSYSCQSTHNSHNGILLDMSLFKEIKYHNDLTTISVGAGLTFSQILRNLKMHISSVPIHGQCLNVGVAGFSLHGGVHFGSLSEKYGLGSSSIVGVQLVIANGTLVNIDNTNSNDSNNAIECSFDGRLVYSQEDIELCKDLFAASRGSGSSFSVVVSMMLKLHSTDNISTAISVLSLNLESTDIAQKDLIDYIENLENIANDNELSNKNKTAISITLFGLDKYFKAYTFQLRFAKEKYNVMKDLFVPITNNSNSKGLFVHFVLEVSWYSNSLSDKINKYFNRSDKFCNGSLVLRPWYRMDGYSWAVPSYDLVWGSGHKYAGASLTVSSKHQHDSLNSILHSFKKYTKQGFCSDCVVVIHRVGEGLRQHSRVIANSSSFHSSLANSYLWLEFDCGHFYRQSNWNKCENFVNSVQSDLLSSVQADNNNNNNNSNNDSNNNNDNKRVTEEYFQYPNVPNLSSKDWERLYYGENVNKLQVLKQKIDPNNLFSHRQSVKPLISNMINNNNYKLNRFNLLICKWAYRLSAWKDYLRFSLILLAFKFVFESIRLIVRL